MVIELVPDQAIFDNIFLVDQTRKINGNDINVITVQAFQYDAVNHQYNFAESNTGVTNKPCSGNMTPG